MPNNGEVGFWQRVAQRFSLDVGIDLGTANTVVFVAGKGVQIRQPSVVAVNKDTGQVLKVGTEAKEMLGLTPANGGAILPLKEGVIAEYGQPRSPTSISRPGISRSRLRSHIRPRQVRRRPRGTRGAWLHR